MPRSKSKQEEFELLAALGGNGMAAVLVLAKLMRALRTKEVLRDIEILAILDAARDTARSLEKPSPEDALFAQAVLRAIDYVQSQAVGDVSLAQPQKH